MTIYNRAAAVLAAMLLAVGCAQNTDQESDQLAQALTGLEQAADQGGVSDASGSDAGMRLTWGNAGDKVTPADDPAGRADADVIRLTDSGVEVEGGGATFQQFNVINATHEAGSWTAGMDAGSAQTGTAQGTCGEQASDQSAEQRIEAAFQVMLQAAGAGRNSAQPNLGGEDATANPAADLSGEQTSTVLEALADDPNFASIVKGILDGANATTNGPPG